jgi:hypothetical protein
VDDITSVLMCDKPGCKNLGSQVFVATKFYMVTPICEASLWNCFMSLRLLPRIFMCLLDFYFLENMSTTEVNYCLPFGGVRKTTRNLGIVDVAAETAT